MVPSMNSYDRSGMGTTRSHARGDDDKAAGGFQLNWDMRTEIRTGFAVMPIP